MVAGEEPDVQVRSALHRDTCVGCDMRAADITTSQAVGHLSPGEIERMVQVAAQMKADDDKVLDQDDTFMCNMCVCVCVVYSIYPVWGPTTNACSHT